MNVTIYQLKLSPSLPKDARDFELTRAPIDAMAKKEQVKALQKTFLAKSQKDGGEARSAGRARPASSSVGEPPSKRHKHLCA